jgi:multidrug resistance efflux pump
MTSTKPNSPTQIKIEKLEARLKAAKKQAAAELKAAKAKEAAAVAAAEAKRTQLIGAFVQAQMHAHATVSARPCWRLRVSSSGLVDCL